MVKPKFSDKFSLSMEVKNSHIELKSMELHRFMPGRVSDSDVVVLWAPKYKELLL